MHHAILHISKLIQSNIELRNLRRYQAIQGKSINNRIGIHHEKVLVECRVHADDVLDLVVHFQLERVHRSVEVHFVQEMHK